MTDISQEDEVDSELVALTAIYEDKLKIEDVEEDKVITITIYPATAEDKSSQYVFLKISFTLPQRYPTVPPHVNFSLSRGLSDSSLSELKNRMDEIIEDREGECIIFDLMELAKDSLTSNNIPSCECSICLSNFQEGDDFLKTECYHYFHCHCLWNYYNYCATNDKTTEIANCKTVPPNKINTTVPCPICRILLTLDHEQLANAKPPLLDTLDEPDSQIMKQYHEKYDEHYQKQLKNGGLIDLEYEQNKFLLSNIQRNYETQIAAEAATSVSDQNDTSSDVERRQNDKKEIQSNGNQRQMGNNEKFQHGRSHYQNKNRQQPHLRKSHEKDFETSEFSNRGNRVNKRHYHNNRGSRTPQYIPHRNHQKIDTKTDESEDKSRKANSGNASSNETMNKVDISHVHFTRCSKKGMAHCSTAEDRNVLKDDGSGSNFKKYGYRQFDAPHHYRNNDMGNRTQYYNYRPHRFFKNRGERTATPKTKNPTPSSM
ncbi:E3 ubiquitin-protein ligase RNF25-like [Styela clava]